MKKKALIFTLDAIFAVLIATSIIVSSYFYFSKTDILTYTQQDIYRVSLDTLTILEKSSTLKNAVETSSTTNINSFIDTLPNRICTNVTIFDKNSNTVLHTLKTGCTRSLGERTFTSRVFIANYDVYYARVNSWYE